MGPRVIGVILVVIVLVGGGVYAGVQLAGDDEEGAGGGPIPRGERPPVADVPESRAPDTTTTSSGPPPPLASVRVKPTQVAALEQPTDMAIRPGDETLYVAERPGRVVALRGDAEPEAILDISADVSGGGEQGLLAIEFTADGSFLYTHYTDVDGHTRLVEWAMQGARADTGSRRDVLKLEQPFANHNGGAIEFGPDGFLYMALGDGGSGGDPEGNAQNLGTLLGKILRIHPRPTENAPYAVPSSNPFLGSSGARGEIWAYGLRNPWQISFDRFTGDLWIGDVGQGEIEEIDFQPASSRGGENYGWDRLEGTQAFEGSPPETHVLPVHEYRHGTTNCSVTGGVVYRGDAIAALQGAYLFADYCAGEVQALRLADGKVAEVAPLNISVPSIVSFGEDADGELYMLSLDGGVFRLDAA